MDNGNWPGNALVYGRFYGNRAWFNASKLIQEPGPWVALFDGDREIGRAQQYTDTDSRAHNQQWIRYETDAADANRRLVDGKIQGFSLGGHPVE